MILAVGVHILVIGSLSKGKPMLAHPMYTILPPPPESLKTTRIYSAMGRLLASRNTRQSGSKSKLARPCPVIPAIPRSTSVV